ncbi:MAG: hypothetical protein HY434_02410 [Candidatus Liptonbacteria bacterium]|nr:hypothetical protein [Candidatus Liptonbacteria bacterium]
MSRFLYLFIIIAAIVLVVLVGYYLRYRPGAAPSGTTSGTLPGAQNQNIQQNPASPTGSQTPQQAGLPSASGTFGLVAQNPAADFFVDRENNVIIVQPDGQVVKVTKGEPVVLSSSVIAGLISAEFSYDGKKVLASFGDPSAPQASVFDVASKSWQPLPLGAESAVWSPTSHQIAYFKEGADYKSLLVLNVSKTTTKPQELAKLRVQDVSLNWVRQSHILLVEKSSAAVTGAMWMYDTASGKLTLVSEGLGLQSFWNETSTNVGLVFSAARSGHGGILSLIDALGNVVKRLRLATLPSKCAFGREQTMPQTSDAASSSSPNASGSSDVLYCAVPRDANAFSKARLPDDYSKKALFTADDLYKIDLSQGNIMPIFNDESQLFDASNLKVFGQNLFFVNRLDSKVYAVSLGSNHE